MKPITSFFPVVFLLSAVFTSCETTLDVDLPEPEARLVTHCFVMNSDEQISASVSTNVALLSSEDPADIDDATVRIFEEGALRHEFLSGESVELGEPFRAGRTYELQVEHPTLGAVSARQTMPGPVPVTQAEFDPDGGIDEFGDKVSELVVRFSDPAGGENYYELGVVYVFNGTNFSRISATEDQLFGKATWNDFITFDDRTFNGKDQTFTFRFYGDYLEPEQTEVFLIWRSISRERYLYLNSLTAQLWNEDNPFAEPVSVFSNVEGGIGVFALGWEELVAVEVR